MSSILMCGFTVSAPGAAPSLAAGTATGSLTASSTYQYEVTFISRFGETTPGSSASLAIGAGVTSINLTSIPVSTNGNVTARKIYRTTAGGSNFLYLATIADNLTTTYSDLAADGSLGAAVPTSNTAGSLQNIQGVFSTSSPILRTITTGITAHAGGGQANAVLLTSEFNVISVVASGADSVRVPFTNSQIVGSHLRIRNNGANALAIFPSTGQQINSAGANVAFSLAAASAIDLIADTASDWIVV